MTEPNTELDDWYAALSSSDQLSAGADRAASNEGTLLRAALKAQAAIDEQGLIDVDSALRKALTRARADGLLPATTPRDRWATLRRFFANVDGAAARLWPKVTVPVAAFSLATIGVLTLFLISGPPASDDRVLRAPPQSQEYVISEHDPSRAAVTALSLLQAGGVEATLRANDGAWVLDVMAPESAAGKDALHQLLGRYSLPSNDGATTRFVFIGK